MRTAETVENARFGGDGRNILLLGVNQCINIHWPSRLLQAPRPADGGRFAATHLTSVHVEHPGRTPFLVLTFAPARA